MPTNRRLIYWDACVFLTYINGDPDKLPTLEGILDGVQRSRNTSIIVTSVLTIAEVAFASAERAQRVLDARIEAQIDQLLHDTSVIVLAEFHELIALQARDLVRSVIPQGGGLKPPDAIHLATAISLEVEEFHTYDKRLLNLQGVPKVIIREPYIQEPRTMTLFDLADP